MSLLERDDMQPSLLTKIIRRTRFVAEDSLMGIGLITVYVLDTAYLTMVYIIKQVKEVGKL